MFECVVLVHKEQSSCSIVLISLLLISGFICYVITWLWSGATGWSSVNFVWIKFSTTQGLLQVLLSCSVNCVLNHLSTCCWFLFSAMCVAYFPLLILKNPQGFPPKALPAIMGAYISHGTTIRLRAEPEVTEWRPIFTNILFIFYTERSCHFSWPAPACKKVKTEKYT